MTKTPSPESPTEQTGDPSLEESFYEIPPELGDEPAPAAPPRRADPTAADVGDEEFVPVRRFPVVKVAIAVGLLVCIGAGLMAFRAQGRRRAVREGIARAEEIMRLDTAEGYRKAADLLAPHAQLDPLQAGSARAFALAMLAADYRDARAESEANGLLVVPGRAESVPPHAALAFAALALGKNVLGDATSQLSGAPGNPWAEALQARIALRAGTLDAAVEPATSAAAQPGFAAGLAVHGDAARRARHDPRTAKGSYEAALAASPLHPRAGFGLAKLALAGQAPESEAREVLSRILDSGDRTPLPERGRAGLHLAALRIRQGEQVDAIRRELVPVLELNERAADWLMGAARAEAANRGPYRAVSGAPESLESASDDDPPELRPMAAEPPPPPPPPKVVEPVHATPAKAAPAHGKSTVKPARGAKPSRAAAKPARSTGKHTAPAKAPARSAGKKKPGGRAH